MFTLAPAQPKDARRLSEFAEKSYRDTFAKDNTAEDLELYVAGAFSEEKQRAEIDDPGRLLTLAWKDTELVGFSHLVPGFTYEAVADPRAIELLRFYVDSRWHGQGVAPLLMRDVLEKSQRGGFTTLWLGVWEKNFRAQAFYRKWDFTEIGSHIFQMGNDPQRDLIFARAL